MEFPLMLDGHLYLTRLELLAGHKGPHGMPNAECPACNGTVPADVAGVAQSDTPEVTE